MCLARREDVGAGEAEVSLKQVEDWWHRHNQVQNGDSVNDQGREQNVMWNTSMNTASRSPEWDKNMHT